MCFAASTLKFKKFPSLTPVDPIDSMSRLDITDMYHQYYYYYQLKCAKCEYKPETGNTNGDQIVEKLNKLRPDILLTLIQVVETNQLAIPHVCRVVVIVHCATSVEIFDGVGHLRIVEVIRVRPRVSCSVCVVPITGHMVHYNVHIDPYTRFVASRHHIDELFSRARSRDPFVGNRLITFPPWPLVDHNVLLYR